MCRDIFLAHRFLAQRANEMNTKRRMEKKSEDKLLQSNLVRYFFFFLVAFC